MYVYIKAASPNVKQIYFNYHVIITISESQECIRKHVISNGVEKDVVYRDIVISKKPQLMAKLRELSINYFYWTL